MILGKRESGTKYLVGAVEACKRALQEWTQDRVPLQWATAQNNLGAALLALGERESDNARLLRAVEAFELALQELTQDKVPLDWAMTQVNLGGVNIVFFDKTNDSARLDTAKAHVLAALEVFEQAAPHYAGMAREQLQQIATRRRAAG